MCAKCGGKNDRRSTLCLPCFTQRGGHGWPAYRKGCRCGVCRATIAEQQRHSGRRKRYGVSREAFAAMWAVQDGRCAICCDPLVEGQGGMAIDHDHRTGRVRGLLCAPCNKGLGHFRDDSALLAAAGAYLNAV